MRLKTITALRSLRSKRVLVRTDFNIPRSPDGQVRPADAERIQRTVPTIRHLAQRGAIVVLACHLGRPKGVPDARLSCKPLADYLGLQLGHPVAMAGQAGDDPQRSPLAHGQPGSVWMLENLRFDPGEEANDDGFARALARWGEVYVNDAFGNCHRAHASMVAVTRHLPCYAGLLLAEEVQALSVLLQQPKRPFVAVIGGNKLSTKLSVIAKVLRLADHLLLGGNLANTVLAASGVAVGRSPVEEELLPKLRQLPLTSAKLHLPLDVVTATMTDGSTVASTKAAANVAADEYILDIGPDTVKLFDTVMRDAATIVWNGPMGKFELAPFLAGTIGLVHAIAHTTARVVVGGGESVAAVRAYLPKPAEEYPHVYLSTGGGAMLKFLEHGTLPALEPLRVR